MHKCRKTAYKIDSNFFAGFVHRNSNRGKVGSLGCSADFGDGRHGNAFIYDRNAVFAFELFGGRNKLFGSGGHAIVYLAGHNVHIFMSAAAQVQTECNGTNIEVLLAYHCKRFSDLFRGDLHGNDPFHCGFINLVILSLLNAGGVANACPSI